MLRRIFFTLVLKLFAVGTTGIPHLYAQDGFQASCFGESISHLHLPQFEVEAPNQTGGTCYSYAAAAAIEGAVYRARGGQSVSLPKLLPAMTACKIPSEDRRYGLKVGKIVKGGSPLDGGNPAHAIQSVLDMGQVPLDVEENSVFLTKEIDRFMMNLRELRQSELNINEDVNQILNENDRIFRMLKDEHEAQNIELTKAEKIWQASDKKENATQLYYAAVERKELAEKKLNEHMINYRKQLSNIDPMTDKKSAVIADQLCQQGRCFSADLAYKAKESPKSSADLSGLALKLINLPNRNKTIRKNFAVREGAESPSDACANEDNNAVIINVLNALCVGIPVSTVLNMKHALEGNQRAGWTKFDSKLNEHSAHAAVISGFKIHEGKPHFTFRNSWGEIQIMLPFDKACHLSDMAIVHQKGILEGEEVSESILFDGGSYDAAKKLMQTRVGKGWILKNQSADLSNAITNKTPTFESSEDAHADDLIYD